MSLLPDPVPTDDSLSGSEKLINECLHQPKSDETQLYKKLNFRVNQNDFVLLSQNVGYRIENPSNCLVCNAVYTFWIYRCQRRKIPLDGSESRFPAYSPLQSERDAYEAFSEQRQRTGPELWLRSGEFGEVYHALMCCLYCHIRGMETPMRFCLPDDDFGNKMRDLFSWYGIPVKQFCMPEGDQRSTGLKRTTQIITEIFKEPPEATGPVLFSKMRHFMDAQTLDINEGPKHGNLMERYFYPTWAAKYWLNHYLRLTKQRHKLPGMEENGSVDKLPKMRDVERMAIIHVRLDAKSGVGRVMDETTLKHVASSIAKANKRVSEWNNLNSSSKGKYFMPAERFSHIILYGDFDYFGGLKRKAWVEKELNDPNVAVLFISRPWEGKDRTAESPPVRSVGAEDRERINNEVEELWSKFRSIGFDYVPAQVKILSIWTALCKRYNPRACVIGHRSGFIEAAGLIGLPTLYLNNEREKVDRGGNKKPGELLWAPFQSTSRLRMLSDVMNTIIPVEALQKQSKTRGSTTGEVKTLKIAPGYEDELTAALFMFMCCNIDTSSARRYKGYPAWTARVAMRKSVSGRAWLCERYRFATGTSKDCGRKAWDEKDFGPWLRDIGEVWDYEWKLRRLGVLPYNLGDDTHY